MNYATDGPDTGLRIIDDDVRLYQKQENAENVISSGKYLCFWGDTDGYYKNLYDRIDDMKKYALDNGLSIDEEFFVEYSDVMTKEDGTQYFSMRVRIV
jgi:hypothetical protein